MSSPPTDDFQGFEPLKENWFRFPNIICDDLLTKLSRGELVILIYVIRNTVGFDDVYKRITLDEFEHGRRRTDGTRLDDGTGLSRSTIINSIKLLLEKKLLRRLTDSRDLGRVKHYYALRYVGDPEEQELENLGSVNQTPPVNDDEKTTQGSKKYTSEVSKKQAVQRKTLIRKTLKDVATPSEIATPLSRGVSSTTRQTKQPSKFDVKATQEFTAILDKVGVKYRTQDRTKWQHQFRLLREYDKASKDDIKAVIKWYANYYPDEKGQPFAIVCHSAKSFREKFFDKLLPRSQQNTAHDIVNGIRAMTLRDVQTAHRRDQEWGTIDFFRYTEGWSIRKYLADKEAHYRELADIVNVARYQDANEVRFILQAVGLYHLIVDDE